MLCARDQWPRTASVGRVARTFVQHAHRDLTQARPRAVPSLLVPLERVATRETISAQRAEPGHRLRVALRDVLRDVLPLHRVPPAAPAPLALHGILRRRRLALVMVVPEVPPDAGARIVTQRLIAPVPFAHRQGRFVDMVRVLGTVRRHWRDVGETRDIRGSTARWVGRADGLPVARGQGIVHKG